MRPSNSSNTTTEVPVSKAVPRDDHGSALLTLARAAIVGAFGHARHPGKPVDRSAPWLAEKGACFVTLTRDGRLRGCIGSLVPYRSLGDDVTANARAAAFDDPRFPPLGADELDHIRIEVSVLSALKPLPVSSEADALRRIRPHVDGLVLEWGRHRGTFLPQVWDELPDPRAFLAHLRLKAGLPQDFWSDDIRLSRYHVDKWSEPQSGPTTP